MHFEGICGLKTELNYTFNATWTFDFLPHELIFFIGEPSGAMGIR